MLRIPIISAIFVSRLAALIVVGFSVYLLVTPEAVLGPARPGPDSVLNETLRLLAAIAIVGTVGVAALYALFRSGRHNTMRYLAFVALLTPAFLFLPSLSGSADWYISLIIMGVLFLAAISCLLPNPAQIWLTLEPTRR